VEYYFGGFYLLDYRSKLVSDQMISDGKMRNTIICLLVVIVSVGFSTAEIPGGGSDVSAVVLGSGQDGGVPHAGCFKDHCQAARADLKLRRRSPSVALIDHQEQKIFVLDAGPDFDEQLEDLPQAWKKGRNPVDGIFLTHAHVGHYTGLLYLGRAIMATDKLPVYCSAQMADFLRTNGPWSLAVELGNIELHILEPGKKLKLTEQLSITPILVPHRNEFTDTFAFVVDGPEQSLLYLPDVDRWDQMDRSIESLVQTVDIALLDATFYSSDELPGRDMSKIPHPPIVQTMDRLQQLVTDRLAKVLFIHLNHSNLLLDSDGEKLKELRQRGYDIAEDGLTIPL
jgi:pyrroloquinoline quinone biosynthesis protein B